MGKNVVTKPSKRVFFPFVWLVFGWIGGCVFCGVGSSTENTILRSGSFRAQPRLPSKSAVAKLASKYFGSNKIDQIFECSSGFRYASQKVLSDDVDSPYHVQSILKQYSQDHFNFGEPNECDVSISRSRMQNLLHQVYNRDGGTVQCPEVGEIYEAIARAAPDGTVFCETGFNVGSSAAIFLHGSYGTRSEVHSFDVGFPSGAVDFLNEVYSSPGNTRLHAHTGDMRTTLEKFGRGGGLCDVIFLDAKHPEDLELTTRLARGSETLFLYHWHFRNSESKSFFMSSLYSEKTFEEIACMKTLCDLSLEDANLKIIRESCFGRLPGVNTAWPTWWHAVL